MIQEATAILTEHLTFLNRKGFGVRGMQNLEGPALFEEQLQEQLHEILNDGLVYIEPVPILATNIGIFNNRQDEVQYHFHYEWEPMQESLHIRAVEVLMQGTTMKLPISHAGDLWDAYSLYERVKELHGMVQHARQDQYEEHLQIILTDHRNLLEQAGYHEATLHNGKNEGVLARRLETLVRKAAGKMEKTETIQHLSLQTKGVFTSDIVDFKIHYTFIAAIPQLKTKSVTAILHNKPAFMGCSVKNPLPAAPDMYALAKGDQQIRKTLDLLNYVPSGKLQRVHK